MKYYIFLITAVLFFAAACNKNNQDYGLTAYQNKDYITGFHAKWTM